MGFVVDSGAAMSDLPYLKAAMDQAGRYLVGKYSMARDALALAVRSGPRLAGPSRHGVMLVAGGGAADPGPLDPGAAVVRARSSQVARARGQGSGSHAMRRTFLG